MTAKATTSKESGEARMSERASECKGKQSIPTHSSSGTLRQPEIAVLSNNRVVNAATLTLTRDCT